MEVWGSDTAYEQSGKSGHRSRQIIREIRHQIICETTLQWSEVDGDSLNLTDTKTGPRKVWLSKAAQAILARQPRAASPYVFPSPRRPDKPLSHILHLWQRARKEAGLDDVRLHDLRHTVASQAVARGVPLSTVARMLGHADPVMTLRYAHVGDRDLQAAAERIGKVIEAAMVKPRTLCRDGRNRTDTGAMEGYSLLA